MESWKMESSTLEFCVQSSQMQIYGNIPKDKMDITSSVLSMLENKIPAEILEDYKAKVRERKQKFFKMSTGQQRHESTGYNLHYHEPPPPSIMVQGDNISITIEVGEIDRGMLIRIQRVGHEEVVSITADNLETTSVALDPPEEVEDNVSGNTVELNHEGVFTLSLTFENNGDRNRFVRDFVTVRSRLTSTGGARGSPVSSVSVPSSPSSGSASPAVNGSSGGGSG